MFMTGAAIFLGLVFVFIKLSRRTMLRLLGHDMALDVGVTSLALVLHWGTFSGVMAATVAGLMCSIGTSLARKVFGYIRGDQYHVGLIRLEV